MKIEFRESFERDIKAARDIHLNKKLKKLLVRLKSASALSQIPNIKQLAGGNNFYRIRIGDYRVGAIFQNGILTLVRVLHRKEIYRHFP